MEWFRLYNEALHDRKLRRLPVAYRWVWVAVLAMASASPERGALLIAGNVPAAFEDMQDTAAVDLADVRSAVSAFEQQDMLVRRASDGAWVVVNWQKRQFISDARKDDGRPSAEVWRELRAAVFARDNYTCQYCGAHGVSLQCDHVMPVSRGGSNELTNLVTACKPCNLSKHDKTPEEWLS
ncbi:MAG: HNH endonuclease family protein [Ktedonobacterales bacterium]|jgi:hypothetical protein|nr:MAG: HNH endonuclease family protein [Ktedonobacterales bacterium]